MDLWDLDYAMDASRRPSWLTSYQKSAIHDFVSTHPDAVEFDHIVKVTPVRPVDHRPTRFDAVPDSLGINRALKVAHLTKKDYVRKTYRMKGSSDDGTIILAFLDEATAVHFRFCYRGTHDVTYHRRAKFLLDLVTAYHKRVAKIAAKSAKLLDKTKAEMIALKKGWNPLATAP